MTEKFRPHGECFRGPGVLLGTDGFDAFRIVFFEVSKVNVLQTPFHQPQKSHLINGITSFEMATFRFDNCIQSTHPVINSPVDRVLAQVVEGSGDCTSQ